MLDELILQLSDTNNSHCLRRGRYTVKAYPTFLQLHGKTFDYKIAYNTISRLFLLPHNDQRQMFFVVRTMLSYHQLLYLWSVLML